MSAAKQSPKECQWLDAPWCRFVASWYFLTVMSPCVYLILLPLFSSSSLLPSSLPSSPLIAA